MKDLYEYTTPELVRMLGENWWKSKNPYYTALQVRTDERARAESNLLVLCGNDKPPAITYP